MAGYVSKGLCALAAVATLSGCSLAINSSKEGTNFKMEIGSPVIAGGYVPVETAPVIAPVIAPPGQYIPPTVNYDTPWNYGGGGYRGGRVPPHHRRW